MIKGPATGQTSAIAFKWAKTLLGAANAWLEPILSREWQVTWVYGRPNWVNHQLFLRDRIPRRNATVRAGVPKPRGVSFFLNLTTEEER